MADDIKPDVIKKTQDSLGKQIKKPQLTEKLLKKPPFRFLHDIVTNVIKESGFLQGLYTDEELNHENIKDRDGKVAFLDKLINCVKLATGSSLTVRSTKIVAGLEPTRTNELLQAIGQAIDKRIDSSEAVQEVLKKSSKKGGSDSKKKTSELGGTASKQEASKRDRKDPPTSNDTKKSDKKDPGAKAQAQKSEKQGGASDAKRRSSSHQRVSKDKDTAKPSKPGKSIKEEPVEKPSSKISAKPKEDPAVQVDEPAHTTNNLVKKGSLEEKSDRVEHEPNEESSKLPDMVEKPAPSEETQISSAPSDSAEPVKEPAERTRPISALGRKRSSAVKQRSKEEDAELKSVLPSNSSGSSGPADTPSTPVAQPPPAPSRPPSSVPGPSRADKQTSSATPIPLVRPRTAARQGSARPGAPRLRNRGEVALVSEDQVKPVAVSLIVEADGVKEDIDEDDNLVIVENTAIEPVTTRPDSETVRPSSQQGHLVAQILETQKELETGSKVAGLAESSGPKVEIDWDASRQRERGSVLKEVQRLCDSIQTVTRAAHPIGKLLDSLQEDVDSMQQELEHWQSMQRSLEEQLLAEEALTVQSTQPLKDSLQQLQQAVLAQREQLSFSKANIIANDQRIQKLLAGGDSAQKPVYSI